MVDVHEEMECDMDSLCEINTKIYDGVVAELESKFHEERESEIFFTAKNLVAIVYKEIFEEENEICDLASQLVTQTYLDIEDEENVELVFLNDSIKKKLDHTRPKEFFDRLNLPVYEEAPGACVENEEMLNSCMNRSSSQESLDSLDSTITTVSSLSNRSLDTWSLRTEESLDTWCTGESEVSSLRSSNSSSSFNTLSVENSAVEIHKGEPEHIAVDKPTGNLNGTQSLRDYSSDLSIGSSSIDKREAGPEKFTEWKTFVKSLHFYGDPVENSTDTRASSDLDLPLSDENSSTDQLDADTEKFNKLMAYIKSIPPYMPKTPGSKPIFGDPIFQQATAENSLGVDIGPFARSSIPLCTKESKHVDSNLQISRPTRPSKWKRFKRFVTCCWRPFAQDDQ